VGNGPWTDDGRVDARVMKHPRDGKRRDVHAAIARFGFQGRQSSKHAVAFEMTVRLWT